MSVMSRNDFTSFTLTEADLTDKNIGDHVSTAKRDVPGSDGLKWWFVCYPAGKLETFKGYVSLYLFVNQPAKTTFSFKIEGSSIYKGSSLYHFQPPFDGRGFGQFASHEQLRPVFRDGTLKITCKIQFHVLVSTVPSVPPFFELCDNLPTDCQLEVGSKTLKVHKHYLSMLSPVFRSMLSPKRKASRKVKIPDFEFDTVKASIDFCYGRALQVQSIDTYVGILRFAARYKINAVTTEIERFLTLSLSVESVCKLLHYAHDNSKKPLLNTCIQFFKEHEKEVTENFTKLPIPLMVHVLKTAFDLKTSFDVLRHAQANGYKPIIDDMEQHYVNRLKIDDFCAVISYAWEFEREKLKQVCAEFLNENQDDVMKLSAFFALPKDIIGGVLKLGYDLKMQSS